MILLHNLSSLNDVLSIFFFIFVLVNAIIYNKLLSDMNLAYSEKIRQGL